MCNIISDFYVNGDVKFITPKDNFHYFFAYYDMRAIDQNGRHLAHQVSFMDRIPAPCDKAELGYLKNNKFYKIGETSAWNFQQGAMLQFHPYSENTVYYNVCENGKFSTVTHNFALQEKKYTDRATACVSPDGKWGLSINFGRIFDFRAGYGYAAFKDENSHINHPENDGIFLTDMETGKSELIINYKTLAHIGGFNKEQKILVNHITFNPSSDRFIALVRNFPDSKSTWSTSMLVGDLNGNCNTILKNTYASHYTWTSNNEIIIHCAVDNKKSMFKINTDTLIFTEYDMPYFHIDGCNPDIHCNISPDGNYIIGDGYNFNGYRALMAYSLKTGKERTLLKAKVCEEIPWGDFRCDLHARFIENGNAISFDTTCNGKREIATISAKALDF